MVPGIPAYHPIPTDDQELPAYQGPKGRDKESFSDDFVEDQPPNTKTLKKRRSPKINFSVIGIFVFFYMSFFLARAFVPSFSHRARVRAKAVIQCNQIIQQLQDMVAAQGAQRNASSKTSLGLQTHYTLPSGDKIPAVALGVWRADPGEVGDAVKHALKTGYRHIDGAWIYGNEAEVGQALKDSGVPRKDIWVTSKLWNTFHQPADVESALDESLTRLGTDYLDLYLIHWPVAFKKGGKANEVDSELTENPYPTWKKLEELVEKGKIRNIGVSNFNIRRIQNLTANPLKIRPAINQVELSYWNPQPELVQWSKDNGLLLEAYSPLGSQDKVKETLSIPEVHDIADDLGITPAQAYLSWLVQRGVVVLPKSVHPSRIEENFKVTELSQSAFELMEKVATSHKPLRAVDPSKNWGVDIFK